MSKKVEFKIPGAFELPDGVEAGDEFESMATFELQKGGRLCLKAIGDTKMPDYDDDDGKQHKGPPRSSDGVTQKYQEAMERGNA